MASELPKLAVFCKVPLDGGAPWLQEVALRLEALLPALTRRVRAEGLSGDWKARRNVGEHVALAEGPSAISAALSSPRRSHRSPPASD